MYNTLIYIDDTGSPGNKSNSKHILDSTKTWVAVIFKLNEAEKLEAKMQQQINSIKEKFYINELHFKDIYGGRKEFKNVDHKIRLDIFHFFVNLYNEYRFPILVSSLNNKTLENSGFPDSIKNVKIDGFILRENSDFSLWLLLLKCQEYIDKNIDKYKKPVGIYIDEGKQKANSKQRIEILADMCTRGEVMYCSSKEVLMIQFADFLAFSLNKIQNNAVKERKVFDNLFMEIIGNMKWNTDLPLISFSGNDLAMLNKTSYDNELDDIYKTMTKMSEEQSRYLEKLCKGIIYLESLIKKR